MVRPTKYLLKQADKAEAAARRVSDEEISESLLAMARGYRSQAQILKAKKRKRKLSRADDGADSAAAIIDMQELLEELPRKSAMLVSGPRAELSHGRRVTYRKLLPPKV